MYQNSKSFILHFASIMTELHEFVNELVQRQVSLSRHEFMWMLSKKFYPSQDAAPFIEYYIEISDESKFGQHVVHHDKLVEYGVASTTCLDAIKVRLAALDLIESVDYVEAQLQPPTGTTKEFSLTLEAFKIALTRAKKSPNMSVDPRIYAKHCAFLEKANQYHQIYQLQWLERINEVLIQKNHDLEAIQGQVVKDLTSALQRLHLAQDLDLAKNPNLITNGIDAIVAALENSPLVQHNFVCVERRFDSNTRKLKLIAGPEANVCTTLRKCLRDETRNWTLQIAIRHNGSPIDLRNDIQARVKAYVKACILQENARRVAAANELNLALREEIADHNREHRDRRRIFNEEKTTAKRVTRADIPIACARTTLTFVENKFIGYNELMEIIRGICATE